MADSSEPAFLFLYRKGAVAPVDYLSTFATAPPYLQITTKSLNPHAIRPYFITIWRCRINL